MSLNVYVLNIHEYSCIDIKDDLLSIHARRALQCLVEVQHMVCLDGSQMLSIIPHCLASDPVAISVVLTVTVAGYIHKVCQSKMSR